MFDMCILYQFNAARNGFCSKIYNNRAEYSFTDYSHAETDVSDQLK